ncbi:Bgh specific hypothetical protein [Blumeria hordei DH14]|uniref:Uncharacterized protein n=1 Tax=Blumeria graminis f. sp. hordei (strain DH14) TaxID=546991 RepID=N1JIC8_BLUG1|nr:Bgh specific hypothetical protein [Blumeria hordei DH14]
MPKIYRLAVGLFFSEYLQRNIFHASGADLPIGEPEKILNDYVCRDQYFTGATVKASVEHACKFMHTTKRDVIFPALLEEYTALGRDSGTLLTWPLTYENRVYKYGTKGKIRAIFNIECELVGVIIRHESHVQACFELSHDENDQIDEETSLVSQKYVGYKCPLAAFSLSYVRDSFHKALLPSVSYFPKPYLTGTFSRLGDDEPLVWPLFSDHILSPNGRNADINQRYFVVFSRKEGILKIIQIHMGVEQKCEYIRKTIVPFISRLNDPESPQSIEELNDSGRDCSGQIFTGRFIEMNRKKAMIAIADKIRGNNAITISRARRGKGVQFRSWIWPIRGWETYRKGPTSNMSYALIFGPKLQFLDVYVLRKSGFTKCNKINDSKRAVNEIQDTGIDLNVPAFCDGYDGFERDC